MIRFHKLLFILLSVLSVAGAARADAPVVIWPEGWKVEVVTESASGVSRQRAVKNDQNGSPLMVMELTMSPVQSDHQVNLEGVLLEMRKSVQKDFFQGGIKVSAREFIRLR